MNLGISYIKQWKVKFVFESVNWVQLVLKSFDLNCEFFYFELCENDSIILNLVQKSCKIKKIFTSKKIDYKFRLY